MIAESDSFFSSNGLQPCRVRQMILLLLMVGSLSAGTAYAGKFAGQSYADGAVVTTASLRPPVPRPDSIEEAVHEVDSLYGRIVAILRNADIPERFDAVEDTVRLLWREIVTLDSRYTDFDPYDIRVAMEADEEFGVVTEAFWAQRERIASAMPTRGERLERMIEEEVENVEMNLDTTEFADVAELSEVEAAEHPPSEEERKALSDYETMIQWATELFSAIQTPDDIREKRDDLLSLAKREARIRMDLPGERGERLIEDVPELVRLLQKLGAEQMRIMSDPKLAEPMQTIFQESGE